MDTLYFNIFATDMLNNLHTWKKKVAIIEAQLNGPRAHRLH